MFGIENLWLFVLSGLLLNMVPGPDSLLIAGRAAGQGFKAGSAAALGIGSGTLVHITAAAVGLSAILATSATAFMVVKVLGGIYLLYMAFGALKASFSESRTTTKPLQPKSLKQIYMQGFITNLFNPKVAIFFLSFMPQFINQSSDHKALAFLLLGCIFNFNGMIWCHFIAWSCSCVGQKLSVSPKIKKWLNRSVGGLFGFFGIKLLMSTQR
ncbi:LysE family translocator [Celerinatantimonas diazotrophica]|uniref:Threonine/homoserine/homoserine lactone efflux protein n=1 Tax=Celerinatantimonas diazotrophica TaxID=412034 RepID=A0A4V2PRE8_9GAMM|nr:LysE family translocator [Celerinatantimonas diazotrophica]TCK58561.1 threonine/homoserine/homoserine lactone efflux protein [Celerinatantimonas diazotrophica]CAG9297190.1 Leucine efflux protein [Celerinatantimonas diazotrophica]